VADEPVEVQKPQPPIVVPAEVRDAPVAVRVPPDRTSKDKIIPLRLFWNQVPVFQQGLCVALAPLTAEICGSGEECVAGERALSLPQKGNQFRQAGDHLALADRNI